MTLKHYHWLLGIGIVMMLAANYLASATNILGLSMMDLNTVFPFGFMPPGWAFGISWGLIYVGLIVSYICLVRASHTSESSNTPALLSYAKWFGYSIVLNITWIIATTQQRWIASVVIIMGLLYALYRIVLQVSVLPGLRSVGAATRGIYLGWVTIAAVVLGISQAIYAISDAGAQLVLSTSWLYLIMGAGLATTGAIFAKTQNHYALLWSVLALGSAAYAVLGG